MFSFTCVYTTHGTNGFYGPAIVYGQGHDVLPPLNIAKPIMNKNTWNTSIYLVTNLLTWRHRTLLVSVKDQSSHLVYLNRVRIKQQTCEHLSSIGSQSCEITMNEKNTLALSHEGVCFQMLDFVTSNSKLEVSKSNSWKISSFSKTTLLQREPFLTMF